MFFALLLSLPGELGPGTPSGGPLRAHDLTDALAMRGDAG